MEGNDQKKIFPALPAGSVPPLLLRTGAPHFQIRSGATAGEKVITDMAECDEVKSSDLTVTAGRPSVKHVNV